jgi:two-component system NtrC family sensor kinase
MSSRPTDSDPDRDSLTARDGRATRVLFVRESSGGPDLVLDALLHSSEGRFDVSIVRRLSEAVEATSESEYDAILLSLPENGGIETLRGLAVAASHTPIVVLMDRDDSDLERELVRSGAHECLVEGEIDRCLLGRTIRRATLRSDMLRERDRNTDAQHRSLVNFRTMSEATPEPLLVEQHQRLVYLNPAAANLLGRRQRKELLGRPLSDFVHPEDHGRLRVLQDAASSRSDDRLLSREGRGKKPPYGRRHDITPRVVRIEQVGGAVRDCEFMVVEVDFGDGPALLIGMRDLTERQRAQARAIHVDRTTAMGIFAAGMAHEINNPLSYVIGNLDYLAGELPQIRRQVEALQVDRDSGLVAGESKKELSEHWSELNETIDDAREGAERVRSLVADLKVLSRGENHAPASSSLEATLESVLRLMGAELRRRARLVREYEEVPQVRADAAQLAQVCVALLTNAINALPEDRGGIGEIMLSISSSESGWVAFAVRDNGEGMTREVLERAFNPFFTTHEPGGGAGLGLSICETIVEQLGGRIRAESTPGQGAAFFIQLPVAEPGDASGGSFDASVGALDSSP